MNGTLSERFYRIVIIEIQGDPLFTREAAVWYVSINGVEFLSIQASKLLQALSKKMIWPL
jgi:hypothetical protein